MILKERRARSTGTLVQLVDMSDESDDFRWATICVEHSSVTSHETRKLANSWLSHPEEWCEECASSDDEPEPLKFKKIRAGLYRSDEGYEVERDAQGYVTIEQRDGRGLLAGCDDDGWSLALGDNVIDWFETKRDAIAEAQRLAKRATPCSRCGESRSGVATHRVEWRENSDAPNWKNRVTLRCDECTRALYSYLKVTHPGNYDGRSPGTPIGSVEIDERI